MTEQVTGLLLSRGDKLEWKDKVLTKDEVRILKAVLCPKGVPVETIPEQKPFAELKHRKDANGQVLDAAKTLAKALSRAGYERGREWGFIRAYETGLKKLLAHLGLEEILPEINSEYVTRDERRVRSATWWAD